MLSNINFCKVKYCRYINSHTTRNHKCGTCSELGHGQYECRNNAEKLKLREFFNDVIDPNERCELYKCPSKIFHKTIAHHCEHCNTLGHNLYNCPTKIITINCPLCRQLNKIKANQKKIIGLDNECCICYDNKIEVYFPNCGHVCICNECFYKSY